MRSLSRMRCPIRARYYVVYNPLHPLGMASQTSSLTHDFVFKFLGGIYDFEVSLSPSRQLNPHLVTPPRYLWATPSGCLCRRERVRVSESENGASPSLYFVFPQGRPRFKFSLRVGKGERPKPRLSFSTWTMSFLGSPRKPSRL